MNKIQFIVEQNKDGYWAYHRPKIGGIASTHSDNMENLKKNAVESYNLIMEELNGEHITDDDIQLINHSSD